MVYGRPDDNGKYILFGRKYSNITGIDANADIYNTGGRIYLGHTLDVAKPKEIILGNIEEDHNVEMYGEKVTGALFHGEVTRGGKARASLISDDVLAVGNGKLVNKDKYESNIVINKGSIGKNRVPGQPDKELNSAGGKLAPEYTDGKEPVFPTRVGSNMMVDGLLAAGQVDAQHLRTASFSSGSEKLDDNFKWFTVNKDGVKIQDTDTNVGGSGSRIGTRVEIDKSGVLMRTADTVNKYKAEFALGRTTEEIDTNNYIRGRAQRVLFQNDDVFFQIGGGRLDKDPDYTSLTPGVGHDMYTTLGAKDIYFGTRDRDCVGSSDGGVCKQASDNYRAIFGDGGTVDVIGSNFKVFNQAGGPSVFTVKAGYFDDLDDKENNGYVDIYTKSNSSSGEYGYTIAMHGPTVITKGYDDDRSGKYISIGTHLEANSLTGKLPDETAAINVKDYMNLSGYSWSDQVAQRVLNIDTHDGYDSPSFDKTKLVDGNTVYDVQGPKSNDKDNGIYVRKGALALGGFGENGTTYITKGNVVITPTKQSGLSAPVTASESKGSMIASRFVSNNVGSNGKIIQVPKMIKDGKYEEYNGPNSTSGRYDTYMVNPAYTSVMNDIKVVSRGGARLSDILPDFITKAIYVASNDKDESMMDNFVFTLKKGSGNGHEPLRLTTAEASNPNYSWSSPYLGIVPAPQCPPGYGRVITVNPTSMQMAQAGKLFYDSQRANKMLGSKKFAMSNATITELKTDSNNAITNQPYYNTQFLTSSSVTPTGMSLSVLPNTPAYVLTTTDQNARPLVFQQSTWLKAAAVPLVDDKPMKFGDKPSDDDYVRGWAVLMGFLYRSDEYKNFVSTGKGYLIPKTNDDVGLYWNVFPVMKHTLEAIVTTYCYFDRWGIYDDYGNEGLAHIDNYNVLKDVPDSRDPKGKSKIFREGLNDPALKYKELW
ncbi:MAG: hypothetical protein ILA52_01690 [Alphaproteobacteria bacterium]|nr:hypothetical protein [Alphaproteobacteria bacterium]